MISATKQNTKTRSQDKELRVIHYFYIILYYYYIIIIIVKQASTLFVSGMCVKDRHTQEEERRKRE